MSNKEDQIYLVGCGLVMLVLVAIFVSLAAGFMFVVSYGFLAAAAFTLLAALYFFVGATRK